MRGVKALSFDLDDTLWEIMPVIRAAEASVYEYLCDHYPGAADRFEATVIGEARARAAAASPELAHDFTEIRRRSFALILVECGEDPADADVLLERFMHARHQVQLYPDVVPALEVLSTRFPLVALSNGNTDVNRLNLRQYFVRAINARGVGALKPDGRMFASACDALGLRPDEVLHVGDHPVEDVHGALNAGMRTVWVNRARRAWEHAHTPHAEVRDLGELLALMTEADRVAS